MFEGLFQPVHLIVIFGIALLISDRKSYRNSAKESATAFVDSSARW